MLLTENKAVYNITKCRSAGSTEEKLHGKLRYLVTQ